MQLTKKKSLILIVASKALHFTISLIPIEPKSHNQLRELNTDFRKHTNTPIETQFPPPRFKKNPNHVN